MCGIAGVINTKEEYKEISKKIFKSIIISNEERGKDSTGVLAIDREKNGFSLFKDTIPASKFMKRKKFRQVEADVWIGHTRLATTGEVNVRNAHPLQRKEVFLVHNGVITNHKELGDSLNFEHEVDSEILIPIVEKKDWDLLQEVKGSANFIAWNRKENELYVERHDNPLYCLTLRDMGIVMFSSVKDVLHFVANHYSNNDEVFEFPNNMLTILDMYGRPKQDLLALKFPVEVVNNIIYPYQDGKKRKWDTFDDERYPYYNDYYDDKKNYLKDIRTKDLIDDGDDESDIFDGIENSEFCEVCGCELSREESEEGIYEWGVPLCYSCLTDLEIANETIRDGGEIDLKSEQWKRYKDILEPCI